MADERDDDDSQKQTAPYAYRYWDMGLGDSNAVPERLASGDAVALAPSTNGSGGASVWNAAGTWEERSLGDWAKDKLRARLTGFSFASPPPGLSDLSIVRVSALEGDASVLFVRGKKRPGFTFTTVTLDWRAQASAGGTVEGHATFSDLSETSIDELGAEAVVSVTSATKHATAPIARAMQQLEDAFNGLLNDLRAR